MIYLFKVTARIGPLNAPDFIRLSIANSQKSLCALSHIVHMVRLGRFAIDAAHRGNGIGRILRGCIIERCMEAKKQVAAHALIVDAKNTKAKSFYAHYGFVACHDKPMTLYFSLGNR